MVLTVALAVGGVAVGGIAGSGLAASAAGRATATADGAATWTVATASNHFGNARRNYAYVANPGGRLEDAIVVSNQGGTPITLRLYAADGYTTSAGDLDLRAEGTASKSIGAWVTPARSAVTVEPGSSVTVPFTVVVPKDARAGDHLGGIVASRTQPSAAGAGGSDVERRVGLRIQLRVGGAFEPRLATEDLKVAYAGTANPFGTGSAVVTYTIRNTGNAVLRARQSVGIAGPLGHWPVRGGAVPDSPALLPGETWAVTVPVQGVVPSVGATATVTLTPLLTDPAGSTAPLAPVDASATGWAVPWTLLLLLAALVGLAVVAVRLRRRGLRASRLWMV
ncbi:WxL protein peptidoglycan domain-containing protein [Intrasporangium mesophilum]